MNLVLHNVRRFADDHVVSLRPLTLIVGENSAGKSTLLAALVTLLRNLDVPSAFNFNEAPFALGTFDTIATYRGGKHGRASSFLLGLETNRRRMAVEFSDDYGTPRPTHYSTSIDETAFLDVSIRAKELSIDYKLKSHRRRRQLRCDFRSSRRDHVLPLAEFVAFRIWQSVRRDTSDRSRLADIRRLCQPFGPADEPTLLAPIRTKPRRTYDTLVDTPTPEGDHIPLMLSRVLGREAPDALRADFDEALREFGADSGLFSYVKPRRLGSKPSSPFQMMIKTSGPAANLMDVGYGVSQALPIASQIHATEPDDLIVVQQPEVHLHPRAQAALGSLFVKQVASHSKQIIVETHSDYLVDRVRRHIKQGDLRASQVGLVFVDMHGSESYPCRIELDDNGNIVDAPSSYRDFFIREDISFYLD